MKYEGPNSYQSNHMANVSFGGQTNRQTDGPKTICLQSIDRGHKKKG